MQCIPIYARDEHPLQFILLPLLHDLLDYLILGLDPAYPAQRYIRPPMQVQIASDLYLELERPRKNPSQYELPMKAPNVVLNGDTGWTVNEKLFVWLKALLTKFRIVFCVSGNKVRLLSVCGAPD